MKGIHWSVWVALIVLILLVVLLSARKEGYAPPRDQNTQSPYTENVGNVATTSNNLPYVDSTSNVVRIDNQSQIYKDMGGLDFQLQSGNPILDFIQGDPSSNVIYGDFVPNESDGGSARMYAVSDQDMIAPETTGKTNDNCPRSVAIIQNKNLTLKAGTHSIDRDSYKINIYPPLHIIATGPNNTRQEMNDPSTESCPSMTRLVLDTEKTYDTLIISVDASLKEGLEPIPENPTIMKTVYGIDVYGNLFNAREVEVTREKNTLSNIRYGFDAEGNPVTNSNDNAKNYGFDEQGNLPSATSNVFTIQGVDVRGDLFDVHGNKFAGTDVTQRTDANQYIPELTSFTIPFLGNQPGISA